MKKITLSILILLFTLHSQAQLSIGAGSSYNNFLDGHKSYAVDLMGEYTTDKENFKLCGYASFLPPGGIEGKTFVLAKNNNTSPYRIEVSDQTTYSMVHVSAGVKAYFDDVDDLFNYYMGFSAGILYGSATYEISDEFDRENYHLLIQNYDPSIPGSKETLSNLTASGKLGVAVKLIDKLFFTLETELSLISPRNNTNLSAQAYGHGLIWRSAIGLKYDILEL